MKKVCEHCGAESAPGMHKRWHGDNCKQKPSSNQSHVSEANENIKLPVGEDWPKGSLLSEGEKKMSTFVEVISAEKHCEIIINLDHVTEIVPLAAGGCIISLISYTGKYDIRVKDSYALFRQFAMQTVSAEDIERQVKRMIPDITRM